MVQITMEFLLEFLLEFSPDHKITKKFVSEEKMQ